MGLQSTGSELRLMCCEARVVSFLAGVCIEGSIDGMR